MDRDSLTSFAEERMDYWRERKEEALHKTTMTWRGIKPTGWIFDEMVEALPKLPTDVLTLAELDALIRRIAEPLPGPTQQEVADAMEARLAETEAAFARVDAIQQHVLSAYGFTPNQLRVVPRTYRQRKDRRKKVTG